MNNGEFFSSGEYNASSEYKHFPAEVYKKPFEENESGKENSDLGKETVSLQTKQRPKSNGGVVKTLIDKLFGSLKSVAVTTTVAAASLVITTTFVSVF